MIAHVVTRCFLLHVFECAIHGLAQESLLGAVGENNTQKICSFDLFHLGRFCDLPPRRGVACHCVS